MWQNTTGQESWVVNVDYKTMHIDNKTFTSTLSLLLSHSSAFVQECGAKVKASFLANEKSLDANVAPHVRMVVLVQFKQCSLMCIQYM